MTREEIDRILLDHAEWLRGRRGKGAELDSANLEGADLRGANLRHANLMRANLMRADLRGAELMDADLRWADLRWAYLRCADLGEAYLMGTNFGGACLTETVLDPMRPPNGDADDFERLNGRHEWCIGFRTQRSPYMGGPDYQVGEWYTVLVFSISDRDCHPGLYVYPHVDMVADEYPREKIISVIFRPWDCHRAGTKWRVREFLVWDEV